MLGSVKVSGHSKGKRTFWPNCTPLFLYLRLVYQLGVMVSSESLCKPGVMVYSLDLQIKAEHKPESIINNLV